MRARMGGALVFGRRVDRCNLIEEAVAGRAREVVICNTRGCAAVDIGLNAVFAEDVSALFKLVLVMKSKGAGENTHIGFHSLHWHIRTHTASDPLKKLLLTERL